MRDGNPDEFGVVHLIAALWRTVCVHNTAELSARQRYNLRRGSTARSDWSAGRRRRLPGVRFPVVCSRHVIMKETFRTLLIAENLKLLLKLFA